VWFGLPVVEWVPPTSEAQLPKDYREVYGEKRVAKVEKFAKFLSMLGMKETAEKIKKDPRTYEEEPFNAQRTWTEYGNRLVGFLAGNGVLIIFLWGFWKYRKDRRFVWLSLINLIAIGLNGWFGSIVVATNLVPWTITVHMFLALLVVCLQLLLIRRISPVQQKTLNLPVAMKWLIGIIRAVLVLMILLVFLNYKTDKVKSVYWAFLVLIIELVGGVLLAYADMPGLVQVSHLLCAVVLFGILFLQFIRLKPLSKPLSKNSIRG